jgi:hypothetical protein
MVRTDPYTPVRSEYECVDCGDRLESPAEDCGSLFCEGTVQNVAVARE